MKEKNKFTIKILSFSLLIIIAFVLSIVLVVIPYFEQAMLERKRETIKELTNSAWTLLVQENNRVLRNEISQEEAQKEAIEIIKNMRYGDEMKDYFWITDMHPTMIIHPYISELNGKDLSDYADPKGKKVFVECVRILENNEDGYIDYWWQWKDDADKIVPKLSYVKKFKEWNWIIGTGIYVEDVKHEIALLERKLFTIFFIITLIIGVGIMFLVRQNIITERKRQNTHNKLLEARNKYKQLVEASTEGVVMILENNVIYSNKLIQKLLGLSGADFLQTDFFSHFVEKNKIQEESNKETAFNFEAQIISKSKEIVPVVLNFSPIEMNDRKGFVVEIKDVSTEVKIKKQLDENIERFRSITNNIDLGIFRLTFDKDNSLIEANKKTFEILGYGSDTELSEINLLDHFYSKTEKKTILKQLIRERKVINQILQVRKIDNSIITSQISLFTFEDEENNLKYCDGIVRDISNQYSKEIFKEEISEDIQTIYRFYNQPVKSILKNPVICDMQTSIRNATIKMTKADRSSILISTENDNIIGIVTDSDIRKRVVSSEKDIQSPVFQIMTAPLHSIKENSFISEALLTMKSNNIRYLGIHDENQTIKNVISIGDIATVQNQIPNLIIKKIRNANVLEDLRECFLEIPLTIKTFIESGAKTRTITKLISKFSDEIIIKIISDAIKIHGEPPAKFAFLILGSVGREEQTLVTDQDNAIVFEDSNDNEKVREYFLKIGGEICNNLDFVGYQYCEGEIMANNPKWVMSISETQAALNKRINTPEVVDLIEISSLFDFRTIYGDFELGKTLQEQMNLRIKNDGLFFYHLANNIVSMNLPVSFFGNLKTQKSDNKHKFIDLKKVLAIIVGFARIKALKHSVNEKNTIYRIEKLHKMGIMSYNDYHNLKKMYDYFMNLRLNHQIQFIENNRIPNNNIETSDLTQFDKSFLLKIFSQISDYKSNLSFEYKIQ